MQTDQTLSSELSGATTALPPASGSSTINLAPSERVVSAFGGAALSVIGLRNLGTLSGITLFLGGSYLLARGLSGYCAITNFMENRGVSRNASGMEANMTFTINSPKSEVYAFWRKLENLPRFMQHLESVEELDDKRSTWTAKVPGGIGKVSWNAEIQEDISGERISWCSLPGSTIDNAGEVLFKDASGGSGTEITVKMSYRLPGGDLGSVAAKLFNPAVEKMMREDIKSFKRLIENGSTPTPGEGRSSQSPSTDRDRQHEYSVSGY